MNYGTTNRSMTENTIRGKGFDSDTLREIERAALENCEYDLWLELLKRRTA